MQSTQRLSRSDRTSTRAEHSGSRADVQEAGVLLTAPPRQLAPAGSVFAPRRLALQATLPAPSAAGRALRAADTAHTPRPIALPSLPIGFARQHSVPRPYARYMIATLGPSRLHDKTRVIDGPRCRDHEATRTDHVALFGHHTPSLPWHEETSSRNMPSPRLHRCFAA